MECNLRGMSWTSPGSPAQRQSAIWIAEEIGKRLRLFNYQKSHMVGFPNLSASALDHLSVALLFDKLNERMPSEDYDILSHRHFSIAISGSVNTTECCLYYGLANIGFVASELSNGQDRYENLLAAIDETLYHQSLSTVAEIRHKMRGSQLRWADYDVVSGLSGILAYMLRSPQSPQTDRIVTELTSTLMDIVRPAGNSARNMLSSLGSRLGCEEGLINCGLAHGVPGILAALSLAKLSGVRIANLPETIVLLTQWLIDVAVEPMGQLGWTFAISSLDTPLSNFERSANGWCYGAPGILRSIWLGGLASDDSKFKAFALQGVKAVLRQQNDESELSPSICHGIAGRLAIAMRFFNDTEDIELAGIANELSLRLISKYRSTAAFGYKEMAYGDNLEDDPGFLTGNSGIGLVLLAYCGGKPPTWDRSLMLA